MESGTRAKLLLLLLLLWVLCFRYEHADGPNLPGPLLELDNGGTEGDWAEPEMCPKGYNAKAFSVKVRAQTFIWDRAEMFQVAELGWYSLYQTYPFVLIA